MNAPAHKPQFSDGRKTFKTANNDHMRLTEDELMICSNKIGGFALLNKRWAYLYLKDITEVQYNLKAFNALVLPRETKEMIFSLVKIHSTETINFDDLIKGKGKGIIFLLHGPPGTGKTLTAGKSTLPRERRAC